MSYIVKKVAPEWEGVFKKGDAVHVKDPVLISQLEAMGYIEKKKNDRSKKKPADSK